MKRVVAVGFTIAMFFAVIVSFSAAACTDTPTHIFYGQAYEPALDCLDSVTVVDTISGADTGQSCPLVCIAAPPAFEAGVTVYVSTTCAPYPPLFDVSGTDPQCAPALAAARRQSTCLSDGGVSSPLVDAGADSASDSTTSDANDASDATTD